MRLEIEIYIWLYCVYMYVGVYVFTSRDLVHRATFHKCWLGRQSCQTQFPRPGRCGSPLCSYSWQGAGIELAYETVSCLWQILVQTLRILTNIDDNASFSSCFSFQKLCKRQNNPHSPFKPCHPKAHFLDNTPPFFFTWLQKCLAEDIVWKDWKGVPFPHPWE